MRFEDLGHWKQQTLNEFTPRLTLRHHLDKQLSPPGRLWSDRSDHEPSIQEGCNYGSMCTPMDHATYPRPTVTGNNDKRMILVILRVVRPWNYTSDIVGSCTSVVHV